MNKVLSSLSSIAVAAGVAYAALVALLFIVQRSLLYHPSSATPTPVESGVAEMQVIALRTEDDLTLEAWYAVPAAADGMVIVYFCGNAGHIGHRAFKIRRLMDAGFGALLVGYRAFGGNPGRPSEAGLYADGRAALRFLTDQGVVSTRIALYGESLGTGVAVRMASEWAATNDPIGAVVLETPYTSIADVAARHYPFLPARHLVRDRFDALSVIGAIQAPLLVFHAEDDRIIPIELARRLYDAATPPKEAHWFGAGGHDGLFEAGADEFIIDFLQRAAADRTSPLLR
ncbi:MAG: alpha/beta hydrolase [Rhodospirillales bacterium]|nr:alpha/beta hydrolase [Rhodospirillales bacterium]